MRDPPQIWPPNLCRLACQGQLPAGLSSPPTILLLSGVIPHTRQESILMEVRLLYSTKNIDKNKPHFYYSIPSALGKTTGVGSVGAVVMAGTGVTGAGRPEQV